MPAEQCQTPVLPGPFPQAYAMEDVKAGASHVEHVWTFAGCPHHPFPFPSFQLSLTIPSKLF